MTVTSSEGNEEKTEVFHGEENAMKILLQTMSNVQKEALVCADANSAAFSMGVEPIKNGYSDFKRRGVRIRFITEITLENIQYVKQLMNYAEVRHMDTVKGNMAVSETEYVATAMLEGAKPITETIYSNAKPILEQQRYFFENLWIKAVHADQRIREIEEGIEPNITKIIDSPEDIISRARHVIETSDHLSVCSDLDYLKMIETFALDSIKKVLEKSQNGQHKGVRWIGTINKEDIALVQRFMTFGMEVKHLRYTPLNFSVTNKEFNFTVSKKAVDSITPNVLISNESSYIRQFNSLFEGLWSQGVDAADRIIEIEKGIEPDFFEVINEKNKAAELLLSLSKLAKEEVLFLLPNDKAIVRIKKLGVLDALQKASLEGVDVRLICPVTDANSEIVEQLRVQSQIKFVKGNESQSGIIIVDSSRFISAELVNPTSDTFSEAIGIVLYSNSKRSTSMLRSFFNSLWNQAELYRRLELQEKMEKEFVNMAAHELRTPVQPLLGMTDILMSQFEEDQQQEEEKASNKNNNKKKEITVTKEEIEMIARNAKRLERLTSDILDVSRIEGNALRLNVEVIDLNEKIRIVVNDELNAIPQGKKLKIIFDQRERAPLFVKGDKSRLFEVLSNLIGNAIKFTDSGGTITVTAEKTADKNEAVVSIKDTGKGIDTEILPRLFAKFASKSDNGTGLGLFLSQGIIQAHGGKIWAENNKDGIGATFRFTLPLRN
ncbi:MAG TPA: HAMP domain-containing sensor histidine kinase [Nitrososphaera sp.]|nr:HAMP domain-containing sensor histidine kinase [Nitrososphaera sp.]